MLPGEAAFAPLGSGPTAIQILQDFGAVDTLFLQPKRVRAKKLAA